MELRGESEWGSFWQEQLVMELRGKPEVALLEQVHALVAGSEREAMFAWPLIVSEAEEELFDEV